MDPRHVSGVVLCGGASRRMGRDKAWLPWRGQPLLRHLVASLRPIVHEVMVVARPGQTLPATGARLVTDRILRAGPLGGLEAGLAALRTPYALVLGCDMPWVDIAALAAMLGLASREEVVIPRVAGTLQPLHAVYAKGLQPRVAAMVARGARRLQIVAEHARAHVVEPSLLGAREPFARSVRGVDTWAAYHAAGA